MEQRVADFLVVADSGWAGGLLVLGIEQWVVAYRHVLTGLGRTPMGYLFYQIMAGGFSIIILGIPAALIGRSCRCAFGWFPGAESIWASSGSFADVEYARRSSGRPADRFHFDAACGAEERLQFARGGAVFGRAGFRLEQAQSDICGARCLLASTLAVSCLGGGEGWRYVLSSGAFRSRDTSSIQGDDQS